EFRRVLFRSLRRGRCRARRPPRRSPDRRPDFIPRHLPGRRPRMSVHTVLNPSTGQALAEVERTDLPGVDAAIEKAQRAFETWRNVAPADRARLLRRFAAVIDDHIDELARLEVQNAGHTIGNATWE